MYSSNYTLIFFRCYILCPTSGTNWIWSIWSSHRWGGRIQILVASPWSQTQRTHYWSCNDSIPFHWWQLCRQSYAWHWQTKVLDDEWVWNDERFASPQVSLSFLIHFHIFWSLVNCHDNQNNIHIRTFVFIRHFLIVAIQFPFPF